MGSNPINLMVRFLLEVSALVAVAMWGWYYGESWIRYLAAVGFPILLATVWGVFAVPDDPSRSGNAPVPVPGIIRLLIELTFFTLSALAISEIGYVRSAWLFAAIVIVHYCISYDRIIWLISTDKQRNARVK